MTVAAIYGYFKTLRHPSAARPRVRRARSRVSGPFGHRLSVWLTKCGRTDRSASRWPSTGRTATPVRWLDGRRRPIGHPAARRIPAAGFLSADHLCAYGSTILVHSEGNAAEPDRAREARGRLSRRDRGAARLFRTRSTPCVPRRFALPCWARGRPLHPAAKRVRSDVYAVAQRVSGVRMVLGQSAATPSADPMDAASRARGLVMGFALAFAAIRFLACQCRFPISTPDVHRGARPVDRRRPARVRPAALRARNRRLYCEFPRAQSPKPKA